MTEYFYVYPSTHIYNNLCFYYLLVFDSAQKLFSLYSNEFLVCVIQSKVTLQLTGILLSTYDFFENNNIYLLLTK